MTDNRTQQAGESRKTPPERADLERAREYAEVIEAAHIKAMAGDLAGARAALADAGCLKVFPAYIRLAIETAVIRRAIRIGVPVGQY